MEKSKQKYKLNRKLRLLAQRAGNSKSPDSQLSIGRSRFLSRGWKRRNSAEFDTVHSPCHSDNDLTISENQFTQITLQRPESILSDFSNSSNTQSQRKKLFYENESSNIPQSVSGSNTPHPKEANQQSSKVPNAAIVQMSVFDKKKLFEKFFKLVHKTTSQYGRNYKSEISKESKTVSQKIYKWLRADNQDLVTKPDIKYLFENEKDYQKFCEYFPRELVMEKDIRLFVERSLLERYELTKSLQNMETAVKKIGFIMTLLVALILVLIVAISFDSGLQAIVSISSILFSAGFMFQSSAKNALESILFLFVIHPFDVGDRVYIQLQTDFENLVVTEMHLLSTVFERWDGVKIYVPNYILAMKSIVNIRRSGSICELHRLQIMFDTSTEKLNQFRFMLDTFLRNHPSEYTDFYMVNLDMIENLNRIHVNVMVQVKHEIII